MSKNNRRQNREGDKLDLALLLLPKCICTIVNGGKNRIVSLFERRHVCFSLSSLSLPSSCLFPPSETESDQPYFQLGVGTRAQQLFRNVQVDSKMALMELTAVTHPGVFTAGQLKPSPAVKGIQSHWARAQKMSQYIQWHRVSSLPLVALLFSVFTIYFFSWIFS